MIKSSKIRLAILVIIFIVFSGCDDSDEANNTHNDPPYDSVILSNDATLEDFLIDQYLTEDAYIVGDTLTLNISFGGGCEDHEFELVAYNYFLESLPVKADVLLTHNANNDLCEALILQELKFDLSPLKEEYQTSYSDETNGSIIIRLRDVNNENGYISVEYLF